MILSCKNLVNGLYLTISFVVDVEMDLVASPITKNGKTVM